MLIRAISLWQPWASLIAHEIKLIETRGWNTGYRGKLAIHAAKKWDKIVKQGIINTHSEAALSPFGYDNILIKGNLPLGEIVAVCDLIDCVPTEQLTPDIYGDFSQNRFGWILDNIIRLETPIPCIGKQGFFNVELDIAV